MILGFGARQNHQSLPPTLSSCKTHTRLSSLRSSLQNELALGNSFLELFSAHTRTTFYPESNSCTPVEIPPGRSLPLGNGQSTPGNGFLSLSQCPAQAPRYQWKPWGTAITLPLADIKTSALFCGSIRRQRILTGEMVEGNWGKTPFS